MLHKDFILNDQETLASSLYDPIKGKYFIKAHMHSWDDFIYLDFLGFFL